MMESCDDHIAFCRGGQGNRGPDLPKPTPISGVVIKFKVG